MLGNRSGVQGEVPVQPSRNLHQNSNVTSSSVKYLFEVSRLVLDVDRPPFPLLFCIVYRELFSVASLNEFLQYLYTTLPFIIYVAYFFTTLNCSLKPLVISCNHLINLTERPLILSMLS